MANQLGLSPTPLKNFTDEQLADKENYTPDTKMKTALKLGGKSLLSPFNTPGNSKHKPFKILSDDEISIINHTKSSGTSGKKPTKAVKRRSLATLQQSSQGKGTLVGQGRDSTLSIKEAFSRKGFKKLEDEATPKSTLQDSISNKEEEEEYELAQDAIALMKATEKAEQNDSYWKDLAEERRIALEDTLGDNEKLYDEIDSLREENEKLRRKLNDLECYKILYNNLLEVNHNK